MGIHTGAAHLKDAAEGQGIAYEGYRTLALTQRIMSVGHGGQILLSQTTHDLVKAQLRIASGATLAEIGLQENALLRPRGYAMQLRVNMESMQRDGTTRPTSGTLSAFEPPAGPGVRVDSFGYAGYRTSPAFDSLLAKVIAHSPSENFTDVVQRAYRALCEFRIEGVATNII